MRDLIIKRIRLDGWLDYCFKRGDDADAPPKTTGPEEYEAWLRKLSDEELLAAYDRVQAMEHDMD